MEFLWNVHCCLKNQNRCLSIHTLNYHEQIFQASENNLLCSTILIASYQQRILTNLKLNRGTDMSQPCHYKNWHWFNLAVEFVFSLPTPFPPQALRYTFLWGPYFSSLIWTLYDTFYCMTKNKGNGALDRLSKRDII